MSKVVPLGRSEGWLCGVLASSIVSQLTTGKKGATIYAGYESTIVDAILVLAKLGLLSRRPRDDRPDLIQFCDYALNYDGAEMPDVLAATLADGDERVADMLAAFVQIACGFGRLPDVRVAFSPPDEYRASLGPLTRHGYAEQLGDMFRWTDKMIPTMRRTHLWDPQLTPLSAKL